MSRRKERERSLMEVHVRELFAGRWMEDQSSAVDVITTIENGRSLGVVRVDLNSTLADLRVALKRQLERDRLPRKFAFVERLGKQLVEIWEDEEILLRVKDLVGREAEVLIVEVPNIKRTKPEGVIRQAKQRKEGRQEDSEEEPKAPRSRGSKKTNSRSRSERPVWDDDNISGPSSEDEETRLYSSDNRQSNSESVTKRSRNRWRNLRRDVSKRFGSDDYKQNGKSSRPNIQQDDSRDRRAKSGQNRRRGEKYVSSQKKNRKGGSSTRRYSKSVEPKHDSDEEKENVNADTMERGRTGTVRIRKEHQLTEELRLADDGIGRKRPTRRNSMLRRSISVDDLRSPTSSESAYNGYKTADSGVMDDYFLDRPTLAYSALNLRDLDTDPILYRRKFEPTKMERRIAGLLSRIRGVQEKTALLKNLGEEQWRGRFLQLRRNTQPLEQRVKELEDEEADVEENLIRLFELRKPLRYGIYGDYLKNNYILQAQKLQSEINQLNTQLENIDLDLLKYRKMQKLTQNQNETLGRDIQREKFLRHLLLGRTLPV